MSSLLISLTRFCFTLLLGESVYLLKTPHRSRFPLRLSLSLAVFALAIWGFAELFQLIFRTIGARVFGLPWPFLMIVFFAIPFILTLFLIAFNFRIKWRTVLFAGAGGYSIQHIGHSVISITQYFILLNVTEIHPAVDALLMLLPHFGVTAFIYFVLIRRAMRRSELQSTNKEIIALSLVNLVVCIVLSVFVSYGMGEAINQFTVNFICKIYAILSCTLIICMQAGLFRQNKLQHENQLMEQLLYKERKQQDISKETINLINIKCHDLKYQIRRLELQMTDKERKESINELSNAILIYDSIAKTGNDTLDIVIMEKSLLCDKYKIKFSYIVDGEGLNFISPADLYPLFGNMIDNAMESVRREPDEEKRIISFRVWREKGMLFIHMDNYCGEDVVFSDGFPVTTKNDTDYHGYGIISMRHIVNSYQGELQLGIVDKRFNVDIMFPIPEEK